MSAGDAPTLVRHGLADWRAEARRRFGADPSGWRFVCPSCGHEASCGDFAARGVDASRAAQECLGRVLAEHGDERPHGDDAQPCDWAAFGLLGTLGRGVLIELDDASTTEAFAFADAAAPASGPGG